MVCGVCIVWYVVRVGVLCDVECVLCDVRGAVCDVCCELCVVLTVI